ncbi:MAG: hypothetical protein CL946_03385 [Ectothiorhodospiraceae bacterium]|nr:hypothetical protein [Ectothiorhodospiraceae bacterium]
MEETWQCQWCGEPNDIYVDISAARTQQFTEDCQICCRPNVIFIHIDLETETLSVRAEREE